MHVKWADEHATGWLRLLPAFEYRRPRLFAGVRTVAGIWFLVLTAILYGYGRGGWWAALLIPVAAVCFYAAYRLPRAITGTRQEEAS